MGFRKSDAMRVSSGLSLSLSLSLSIALTSSYPALSCRVESSLVLSCLVLSCLVLSCLLLSCLVMCCLALSHVALSCLGLSCLVFVLSCLVLPWPYQFKSQAERGQGRARHTTRQNKSLDKAITRQRKARRS
jgi:hypothetical protein